MLLNFTLLSVTSLVISLQYSKHIVKPANYHKLLHRLFHPNTVSILLNLKSVNSYVLSLFET